MDKIEFDLSTLQNERPLTDYELQELIDNLSDSKFPTQEELSNVYVITLHMIESFLDLDQSQLVFKLIDEIFKIIIYK